MSVMCAFLLSFFVAGVFAEGTASELSESSAELSDVGGVPDFDSRLS